jgi:hypothetical protein
MTAPLLNRELLEEVSILTKETSILTRGGEYFDKRNQRSDRER